MAPCSDRCAFIAGAMSMGAIVAELSHKWSSRSHRRMVRSHGCRRGVRADHVRPAEVEFRKIHLRFEVREG